MIKKLPVFFHIPKNAGTYINNICFSVMQQYSKTRGYHIDILKDGVITYRLLCVGDGELDPKVYTKLNNVCYTTQFENLDKILNDLELFMIRVSDNSFRSYKNELLPYIKDYDLFEFLVLREPYSRVQSLFSYLKSIQSQNETTHGVFGNMSFYEYLNSPYLEGGWLIRSLLDIPNEVPVSEQHYDKVCEILDGMHVYNTEDVRGCINNVFNQCYSFNIGDLDKYVVYDNKNKEKQEIPFDSWDHYTVEKFMMQTTWDRKLYERYTK